MFNNFDLRKGLIFITVLLLLVVLVKMVADRNESTFASELFTADTSDVSFLSISTLSEKEELVLSKAANGWTVQQNNKVFVADEQKVQEILSVLLRLKPIRVAGIDKSTWKDFDVNDSAAVRLQVKKGKKVIGTYYIGRFNYEQPSGQDYMYNRQGRMTSYVRKKGDEAVYLVDGFLRMTLPFDITAYRNKTLVNSSKQGWNKLSFIYSNDSSFVLERKEGHWLINNTPADSLKVENYLSSIERLESNGLLPDATVSPIASHQLKIEGTVVPIQLAAFPADTLSGYYITSTMNKEAVFSGNTNDLLSRVFVDAKSLMVE
jgi:hypothetical protein